MAGFPWAAVAPVVAQGGMSLIGGITSSINARNENRWARDWQEEMYNKQEANEWAKWNANNQYMEGMWNKQNAYNEAMWHKMNEYNSPMAQMQRFKEAGLNPMLVTGQTNTTSPISSANFGGGKSIGKGSIPSAHGAPVHDWGTTLGNVVGNYYQLRAQAAQTNNLEVQNQLLQQKVMGEAINNSLKGISKEKGTIELDNMKKYSADAALEAFRQLGLKGDILVQEVNRGNTLGEYYRKGLELNQSHLSAKIAEVKERIATMKDQQKKLQAETAIKSLESVMFRDMGIAPNSPWYTKMIYEVYEKLEKFLNSD